MEPARSIPEIAADQFANRRGYFSRQVAGGALDAGEANQRLLPWLAIAAAAGADLPELAYEADTYRPKRGWQVERHRFAHYDICAPDQWRLAVAQARDAAIRAQLHQPNPRAEREALELTLLARALRVPLTVPPLGGAQAASGSPREGIAA